MHTAGPYPFICMHVYMNGVERKPERFVRWICGEPGSVSIAPTIVCVRACVRKCNIHPYVHTYVDTHTHWPGEWCA